MILPKYKMKQDLVKSKINQKMLRTIINVAIEKDLNEAKDVMSASLGLGFLF